MMEKQQLEKIYAKYNRFGGGYKEIDPELKAMLNSLADVNLFLNNRCNYTIELSSIISDIQSIQRKLRSYNVKIVSEHQPDGLFHRGFENARQEIAQVVALQKKD